MSKEIIWEQRNNSFVRKFELFWNKTKVFWVMIFFANIYIGIVPKPSSLDLAYTLFWVAGLIGSINFAGWIKENE